MYAPYLEYGCVAVRHDGEGHPGCGGEVREGEGGALAPPDGAGAGGAGVPEPRQSQEGQQGEGRGDYPCRRSRRRRPRGRHQVAVLHGADDGEVPEKTKNKKSRGIELRALQGRGEIYAGRVGVQGRAVNQMNGNGRGEEGRSQAHFVQALRHARLKAASSFLLPFLSVKLFARLNSPPSHK